MGEMDHTDQVRAEVDAYNAGYSAALKAQTPPGPPGGSSTGGKADWTAIMIECDPTEAEAMLLFFRENMGFKNIDWCEMKRDEDNARITWGPCAPRRTSLGWNFSDDQPD